MGGAQDSLLADHVWPMMVFARAAPTAARLLLRFHSEHCEVLPSFPLRQTCLIWETPQLLSVFLGRRPDFREETAVRVAMAMAPTITATLRVRRIQISNDNNNERFMA